MLERPRRTEAEIAHGTDVLGFTRPMHKSA